MVMKCILLILPCYLSYCRGLIMIGSINRRWFMLLLVLFIAGLFYAAVGLPNFTPVQTKSDRIFQKTRFLKQPVPAQRHLSGYNEVVIDLEQETESPYIKFVSSSNATRDLLQNPRIQEWCQRPDSNVTGVEGLPIDGFKLESVIVFSTPGHTARSSDANDCKWKEFIASYRDKILNSYEEVLSIHKNINVDKGGFKVYDPISTSGCKDGELSPLGISQNIKLGEFMRKSYIYNLKTLKTLARETAAIAHSVQDVASYQSSMAFLHGLLSEKQFMTVGIKKVQDNLCSKTLGLNCKCPALSNHIDFIKPYSRTEPLKQNTFQENETKFPVDFQKYRKYLQDLSRICIDKELCGGPHCIDSTINAALHIFKMVDHAFLNMTKTPPFIGKARLYSHPLFISIIPTLFEPKHDFTHYSIKEFTFVNMLIALGIPVIAMPIPASRISIEVHKKKGGRKKVFRVLVNGRDMTSFVKVCAEEFGSFCNLQTLHNLKIYNYGLACEK